MTITNVKLSACDDWQETVTHSYDSKNWNQTADSCVCQHSLLVVVVVVGKTFAEGILSLLSARS